MIDNLIQSFDTLVMSLAGLGVIAGFFLIILESIFPILPLGVFIAMNVSAFGSLVAYIISYSATVLGCLMSYYLFRQLFSDWYFKKIKKRKKLQKASKTIKKIEFYKLVLVIALPFTPASLVNILCGINKVSQIKFIMAILIGKLFTIFFWVFVGKTLVESFLDPLVMLSIAIMLLFAYILSKIVSKRMNLE